MSSIPSFTFNNGEKVPAFGLGCLMPEAPTRGEQTEVMVKTALKHGYRLLDTATVYGNEEAVGKAIRESGIPREDIFVTTKIFRNTNFETKAVLESSLKLLGLDYIDLWLLHSPLGFREGGILSPEDSPTFVDVWKEMEKVYEEGRVKSIGVSNFSIKTLEVLLKEAKITPVTNQVLLHPSFPQNDLLEYCKKKNIILTAYSPLGEKFSTFSEDPILQDVAKKEGATVAQVILGWAIQRGTIVIPKSQTEDRIKENMQIISLSDASFAAVDNLHKEPGKHRPIAEFFKFTPGKVFGWSYDQLGWNVRWDEEKKDAFAI